MIERRASGRIPVARGALIYCGEKRGVYAGMVRDVSDDGARIQTGGLKLPRRFDLSFDNFTTVQPCRIAWSDGTFVGAAFERPAERRVRFDAPEAVSG
jgi:hypothetical protein